MLQKFMTALKSKASNDIVDNRRISVRRYEDRCVMAIGDKILPVKNWSFTGALLTADNRVFNFGEVVEFTMKFKLRDHVLNIKHNGKIVRKSSGKIALQFDPVDQDVKRKMRQVVDDHAAEQFALSQV